LIPHFKPQVVEIEDTLVPRCKDRDDAGTTGGVRIAEEREEMVGEIGAGIKMKDLDGVEMLRCL
jgi:hypothetical protein